MKLVNFLLTLLTAGTVSDMDTPNQNPRVDNTFVRKVIKGMPGWESFIITGLCDVDIEIVFNSPPNETELLSKIPMICIRVQHTEHHNTPVVLS